MACHLLKAVECWTDLGLGNFELRYLRDKLKREVDFLVVRDRKPWVLVEVKTSDVRLSDSLRYFHTATKAKHAFQAVFELPHVQDARSQPYEWARKMSPIRSRQIGSAPLNRKRVCC